MYRLDPARAAAFLPAGLEPRLVQGQAIAAACYTRLGSSRLFPSGSRGSDHLAYRFAVRRADGLGATWIARRETSSWLEARCGSKLLRGEYGRASFQVIDDALRVELAVAGERGEEFYLRAEAAPAPPGALFRNPQALEDFLGSEGRVAPYDVFAPEADALDPVDHFVPEPLAVFEARSAFFDEPGAPRPELDSAWRFVARRLAPSARRRPTFRVLPEQGSAPALPTT